MPSIVKTARRLRCLSLSAMALVGCSGSDDSTPVLTPDASVETGGDSALPPDGSAEVDVVQDTSPPDAAQDAGPADVAPDSEPECERKIVPSVVL